MAPRTRQTPEADSPRGPQGSDVHEGADGTAAAGRSASKLSDRIIAATTTVLGVMLLVAAFSFPDPGQPEDPGTSALPQLIGFCLVGLGVLLLFNAERNVIAPERGARLRTALMVVMGLGYALALVPWGFVLSTIIFMVVGLAIMGVRHPLRLIAAPVIVALSVHYLFTAVLGVYLPAGLIEGVLP